jgi:hypothetical protein
LNKKTREAVQRFIDFFGEEKLYSLTSDYIKSYSSSTLTIIANKGVHNLVPEHIRGEVFFASEGMLDFSNAQSAENEIRAILQKVSRKLSEKSWSKIFLVPFGPAILTANIKLLVYRIHHIETIDVLHAGTNSYFDIHISQRALITQSNLD